MFKGPKVVQPVEWVLQEFVLAAGWVGPYKDGWAQDVACGVGGTKICMAWGTHKLHKSWTHPSNKLDTFQTHTVQAVQILDTTTHRLLQFLVKHPAHSCTNLVPSQCTGYANLGFT